MKKIKWVSSLTAFCVVTLLCVQFAGYNARQKYIQVSKGFSIPMGNYILLTKEADVDCDGKNDRIYVYGEKKSKDAEYAERINLVVVYAKNGFVKKTNVSHIKGYVDDVVVQDFTGNKNKDVLLKTFTDEGKSIISVFVADFGYDIPKTIMADSRGISPSFSFAEGFVVNCSLINGQNFSVNLESKKQMLVGKGVFDDNGKLVKSEKVFARPFLKVDAKKSDKDKGYELEGVQTVVFGGKETELFKIYSVQKFMGRKWELIRIEVKY